MAKDSIEDILTSNNRTQEFIPGKFILVNVWAYMGDISAISDTINDSPGIYAWYRHRELKEVTPEKVFQEIRSSAHPSFSAEVSRYSDVEVSSKIPAIESSSKSNLKLKTSAEYFLKDNIFANSVHDSIRFSLLFDSPLYIGASMNLKTRITDHLKGNSDLKNHLKTGGFGRHRIAHEEYMPIDIKKTKLLIMYIDDMDENFLSNRPDDTKSADKTLEHITQLLYRPPFVRRLG